MSNDKKVARLFNLFVQVGKMVMNGTRDAVLVADYMQRILDPSLPAVEPVGCFAEKDGIIRSKVVANGWSGTEWEKFYDENGYKLSGDVRKFLNSPDFKPTPAGTVVYFSILKGDLFADNLRTTENVRAKARKLKLKKASHDLACHIRKEFTNEEIEKMGLWLIVGMSDTIHIFGRGPRILGVHGGGGSPWLGEYCDDPGDRWGCDRGFAFEVIRMST